MVFLGLMFYHPNVDMTKIRLKSINAAQRLSQKQYLFIDALSSLINGFNPLVPKIRSHTNPGPITMM